MQFRGRPSARPRGDFRDYSRQCGWTAIYRAFRSGAGLAVPEVSYPGENHGDAELVGGGDDLRVADGASRLDDGGGAGFGHGFEAIGEGEEGIGGGDPARERPEGLHGSQAGCVGGADPARADAGGPALALGMAGVEHGGAVYGVLEMAHAQ